MIRDSSLAVSAAGLARTQASHTQRVPASSPNPFTMVYSQKRRLHLQKLSQARKLLRTWCDMETPESNEPHLGYKSHRRVYFKTGDM